MNGYNSLLVDLWAHVGRAKMRLTTIQFSQFSKICVYTFVSLQKIWNTVFSHSISWSIHRGEYLAMTACKLTQKIHSFDDDMVAYFKNNGHGSTCFQDGPESEP